MALPSQAEQLDAAMELMRIRSTADNPEGLYAAHDFMVRYLGDCAVAGMQIETFESGGKPSLLAWFGDERPEEFVCILGGHGDVVGSNDSPNTLFRPTIRDGILYGTGAVDMKVADMFMATKFAKFGPRFAELGRMKGRRAYGVGWQFVMDEEVGGFNGARYQMHEQGVRTEVGVYGECGRQPGTYEIAYATKGILQANVELYGDPSVGYYAHTGTNAVMEAAQFLDNLRRHYPKETSDPKKTTIGLAQILSSGSNPMPPGFSPDTFPVVHDKVAVWLDMRYARGDKRYASKEAFLEHLAAIDPAALVTEFGLHEPAMYTPTSNPHLRRLKRAAEAVEGHKFSFVPREGTGDGRFITQIGGAACEFGIRGAGEHSINERITLEDAQAFADTMDLFLTRTLTAEITRRKRLYKR